MTSTVDESLKSTLRPALGLSLGMTIFGGLLVLIFGWRMPEYIPLFFSRPFGLKQLASFWFMLIYPALLITFYLSSLLIFKKCKESMVLAAVFIWISTVASSILFLSLLYVLFLVF